MERSDLSNPALDGRVDDADEDLGEGRQSALSGIVEGTKIATSVGWQKVETLQPGDAVLTFDNGLRTVRKILRVDLWEAQGAGSTRFLPLVVPANALGNRDEMILLPRQGVLVESDVAEARTGDPFVLVRAEALDGICGISRRRLEHSPQIYILEFSEDQLVFASSGALCVCPAAGDLLDLALRDTGSAYHILSSETDAELIEDIGWELEEKWTRHLGINAFVPPHLQETGLGGGGEDY